MSDRLAVAFAVEAGPGVGLGHLRRAQALGAVLRARGTAVRVLVDGEADAAASGTVPVAWTRDPALACRALAESRPDAVVVDSYRAAPDFFERLRTVTGCVVAIDDLADRPLPVHLVVNGAIHAARLPYRGAPDTRFLLGPEYALLDPAFAEKPAEAPRERVARVLVALGGATDGAAIGAAAAAVRRALPDAALDLAVGPFSPAPAEAPEGASMHRGLRSLRDRLRKADLAVTGGGMTLYVGLASGTPVVGLCLADNQRSNVDELCAAGIILGGAPSLEAALRRAAGDPALRRALSARGRRLVDGRGASRVADEIARACAATGRQRSAR